MAFPPPRSFSRPCRNAGLSDLALVAAAPGPDAFPQDRISGFGNPLDGNVVGPDCVAQSQEDVHAHDGPGMDFLEFVAQLSRTTSALQAIMDASSGRFVMAAEACRIDELGFVDDAVDFLVLAREAQEGLAA